jgi:hypothetical protein
MGQFFQQYLQTIKLNDVQVRTSCRLGDIISNIIKSIFSLIFSPCEGILEISRLELPHGGKDLFSISNLYLI